MIKAKRTRDMIEKTCVDHHKQSFQMRWHGPFTYHDVGTTFFEGVEWTDVVVDRFCTYVSQLSTTEPPFVESAFAASQMFDVEYDDLCIEAINKRMELGEKYEVPGWGTLLAKGEEVFVPYNLLGSWMSGHMYKDHKSDQFCVRVFNSNPGKTHVHVLYIDRCVLDAFLDVSFQMYHSICMYWRCIILDVLHV